MFEKLPIIKTLNDVHKHFNNYPEFVLGIGNPILRKLIADKLISQGGRMVSIIANSACIGHYDVHLGDGLNVMCSTMISNCVLVRTGTLINAFVSIYHDVTIGKYCEVSPHAALLSGCFIGDYSSIDSNSTVLPNIRIGNNTVVGAGSVVTKDIPENFLAMGIPAEIIKELEPLKF